jgi:hypothetical protein
MMQQVGDCGFFNWADNKMSIYERRIMQWLKDVEEHSWAEVRRLEQLINIKLARFREKMYVAVISLIILVLVVLLYVSGYHGSSNYKYMLK